MLRYLVTRLFQALITMLLMTIIVFFMTRLTGSPLDVMLDDYATLEDRALLSKHLGLDKPMVVQYGIFLSNAVRGDLGNSLRNRRPVREMIQARFLSSVQLGGVAFILCIAIAIPLGVYSAVKKGTVFDHIGKAVALLGQSVPSFALGIMMIMIFSVYLRLLPTSGRAGITSFVMPAVALGWHAMAGILRLTRSAMLDVLDSDYVKMARIKGVSEQMVIWKHCLRNALIPVVTFSGLIFVHLLGGSMIAETIFAWPGLGSLAIESVKFRDYPVTQAVVLFLTALFLVVNMLVDILYAYLDPKVNY